MPSEFVKLVKEMREAQKLYFRTRTGSALELSKRLEKEVDAKIEEFDSPQLKLGI